MKRHIYHYCAANGSNQLAGIAQLTFKIISQQDIHKFMGELEKIGFKAEAVTSLSYLGEEVDSVEHADQKASCHGLVGLLQEAVATLQACGALCDAVPTRLQNHEDDTLAGIGRIVNEQGLYHLVRDTEAKLRGAIDATIAGTKAE